jgi:hypothetical protein
MFPPRTDASHRQTIKLLKDAGAHLRDDKATRLVFTQTSQEIREAAPISTDTYGLIQKFRLGDAKSVGGATGSVRVQADGHHYQLKRHYRHATLKQKAAAMWSNTQNYGEVIGASVLRSVLASLARPAAPAGRTDRAGQKAEQGPALVPQVTLVHDAKAHETGAVSLYLSGGQGDVDAFYARHVGPLPRDQKHVRIDVRPPGDPVPPGTLRLSGQAAQDVARHVAASALIGEHDVNTGNLIMLSPPEGQGQDTKAKGQDADPAAGMRVGRIDFGHAFNHLIAGTGSALVGGGGVRDPSGNRIVDFFNRERVRGNPTDPSSGVSKLWRDYVGLVPSHELAAALNELANAEHGSLREGVQTAHGQFSRLVRDLLIEGGPAARAEIDDIVQCLKTIARNIGKPVTQDDPVAVVDSAMAHVIDFIEAGQKQMTHAARLCELQATIDQLIMGQKSGEALDEARLGGIRARVRELLGQPGDAEIDGERFTWLKTDRDEPAVTGTLHDYIEHRQTQLHRHQAQAAKNQTRVAFQDRLHRFQAQIEKSVSASLSTSAPQPITQEDARGLASEYAELLKAQSTFGSTPKGTLTWIPLKGDPAAFEGDWRAYLSHRLAVQSAAKDRAGG